MSRKIAKQAARMSLVGRKSSPERLLLIIKFAAEMPVIADIVARAGISRTSLKYWLMKSEKGQPGDGFDVVTGDFDDEGKPLKVRFHEIYADAFANGVETVEKKMFMIARGYNEPLTFQGRVIYKQDPMAVALGLTGMDAYLLDEDGKPVPETIEKQSEELMQFIMKAHKPEVYGSKQQIDVTHRGGVLVVGTKKTVEELEKTYGGAQPIQDVEFEVLPDEVVDDDDPTR